MTKTEKLRAEVCYTKTPLLPICKNCEHFTSEVKLADWQVKANAERPEAPPYTIEKHGQTGSLACGKHGFSVQMTASCNDFDLKID